MSKTALEVLLQEAGYSARRAEIMANWIDDAKIKGMSADDLYSAFVAWRRMKNVSAPRVLRLAQANTPESYAALKEITDEVIRKAEEAKRYQMLMPFAAQPENVTVRESTP